MSDTMKEYIAEAEKDLLHTYNRYQIVLDKGEVCICMIQTVKNIWILWPVLLCLHWDIRTKHTTMH